MADKRLCPMLSSNEGKTTECIGNDCAWWDDLLEKCLIYSINSYLWFITNSGRLSISDIIDKVTDSVDDGTRDIVRAVERLQ